MRSCLLLDRLSFVPFRRLRRCFSPSFCALDCSCSPPVGFVLRSLLRFELSADWGGLASSLRSEVSVSHLPIAGGSAVHRAAVSSSRA